MKIKKLMAAIFASFVAFSSTAQINIPPKDKNWGSEVSGMALSIALGNNTVVSGTNITLTCRIKNVSTNLATLPVRVSSANFYVGLTDSSGTLHELNSDPDKIKRGSMIISYIMPGQTNLFHVPLNIEQYIKPGTYQLVASRTILVENRSYKLISNTLKIKVE